MKLKSAAFSPGGEIPRLYTCQGKDINPPLELSEVPKEAQTLCLIVEDPDVPTHIRKDGLWIHWVVINIDPTHLTIAENSPPFAIQGKNTSGKVGYMGPCPPDREHRYYFKLYALDTTLSLKEGCTKEEVMNAMQGHILAEATLMGRYVKC